MRVSISLNPDERNTLLDWLHCHFRPQLRQRAHIILLLADGHSWATITRVLYCSSRTIDRWQKRFQEGRVPALRGQPPGAPRRCAAPLVALVVGWVTTLTPRAFGFQRSRWCCATLT